MTSQEHIKEQLKRIKLTLPQHVSLVCVSKFQPIDAIQEAYAYGERDFGESRVQEFKDKYSALPKDIRWHMIGHLQTNKVKQIIPFVHLIHSVDSVRVLNIINREAEKIQRRVRVLLELHVAKEVTKSGFTPEEFEHLILNTPTYQTDYPWVEIVGVMGMATNTDDQKEIRACFQTIKHCADMLPISNPIISMGMSDDYHIAIEEGSNLIRIGSSLFGERN